MLSFLSMGLWIGLRLFAPALWSLFGVPALIGAGVVFVMFVVTRIWRVQTSRYIITAERTYKSFGRLRFQLLQTTYDKVTDLHVRQSLFGRIWGFGTVRLETAGTGIALEGVRDPLGYKKRVEAARSGFLRTLVAQHVPDTTRRRTSAEVDDASPARRALWNGRPSIASFFGNGIQGSLLAFVGSWLIVLSLFGESVLLVVGGVMLAAGLATLWGHWVRFRYTKYGVENWGVVVTSGWLARRRVETTYEKVTDVTVYQGILGRMFGFGNITINTAGSNQAPVVFHGLGDPEGVKATIDEARRGVRS